MATTPPTRVTDLARNYRLDINTLADPGTNYQQLIGIEDAKLLIEPETVSDKVRDEGGAAREEVVGYSWRIEGKLKNSLNAAGTSRNAVHAFLRTKHLQLLTQPAAMSEFGVRWYHREGIADEAHEGRVYVKTWNPDGGQAQDTISFVLFGQGTIANIVNPASSQVPTVSALSPTSGAAAGGELVTIYGDHFTGATAVDFGTDPAADFMVIDDSRIVAVSPAHAAGMVQVKVTTAAGASANTAADDFTYA